MKKLFFIVAITVSSIVNSQCFTSLTQSQNKLLDKYDISYTGLQTRYIMSTKQINTISDLETKNGMIKSYLDFINWNKEYLQIIPDTTIILETGNDYIKDKILSTDSESLIWLLNDSHHVLQKFHQDINDNNNNIRSIEIVEFHLSARNDCTYIFHMVFIEDYNSIWSSFSSDDTDTSLDCPFCTVP